MSSHELLEYIEDYELDIFLSRNLSKVLGINIIDIQNQLETLVFNGSLNRLERGKYCRRNFNNEYVIGTFLAHEGAVAYWSALHLHGLTEQFPNTVFIQTTRPKLSKKVLGVQYKFIRIKREKKCCIDSSGYGNNAFKLTNLEKTIFDCLDLPQYNGGTLELYHAIYKVKFSNDKLIEAAKRIKNVAAIKRMGFLIEVFDKQNLKGFLKFAQSIVNKKYYLLDPQESKTGKFNKRWRLRINVSQDIFNPSSHRKY